jgi:glycosidase
MNFHKLISILAAAAMLLGCGGGAEKTPSAAGGKVHPEWSLDAVIYELNTRQFTTEGTFTAAAAQLERVRDLGVEILWLMPIHPIGVKDRKGELGSYYSVRDYKAVNPEFGTMDEFKALVERAHSLGMKVILDWVANHTSPDAVWSENKEWYRRDSLGNFIVMYDWTDIAPLDFANRDMRAAMVDAMKFWLVETGIDGFRCDVAHEIPVDFWNDAVAELTLVKSDIFMLAEAEKPELEEKAFDAYYGWELHSIMNGIAAGTSNVDSLRSYFVRHDERFKWGFPMLFTSNHDENSWNGTEFERMGDAATTFAAMTYILPGMPLIYNGQEVGFNRRLEFFKKDPIDWAEPNDYTSLYRSLGQLRRANRALWNGPEGGTMSELATSAPAEVFSLVREKDGNSVIGVFNLSPRAIEVTLSDERFGGEFTQQGGGKVSLSAGGKLNLAPWQYLIYTR